MRCEMKYRLLFLSFFAAACASSHKTPDNVYRQGEEGRPLVDDKYSLQADRQAMEQLRSQVPPEKKRENDELALILGLMNETKKSPSEIRNQFDSMLRKKRSMFDKDMTKEREAFTKEERKKREEFLKSQRDQRETFNHEKHSREERAEFFKELDQKRAEFFSVERDRRGDFESDVRERRKNFEDYAREKQNEFNQEHRSYSKRYEELQKEKREKERLQKQGASSNNSSYSPAGGMSEEALELERELAEIRQRQGTSLQSGE